MLPGLSTFNQNLLPGQNVASQGGWPTQNYNQGGIQSQLPTQGGVQSQLPTQNYNQEGVQSQLPTQNYNQGGIQSQLPTQGGLPAQAPIGQSQLSTQGGLPAQAPIGQSQLPTQAGLQSQVPIGQSQLPTQAGLQTQVPIGQSQLPTQGGLQSQVPIGQSQSPTQAGTSYILPGMQPRPAPQFPPQQYTFPMAGVLPPTGGISPTATPMVVPARVDTIRPGQKPVIKYPHKQVDAEETPKLKVYQEEPVSNFVQVLKYWPCVMNYTPMGGGKTYETCYLARNMYPDRILPMLIYAPRAVHAKWLTVAELYGVPVINIGTYRSLSGTKDRQPASIFVDRHNWEVQQRNRVINKFRMEGSKTYANLLREQPIMLVFDEISKIKNESAQALAAQALIREICRNTARGRVVLLSASPGDKKKNVLNFHRMLCITHQEKYVDKNDAVEFGGRADWYFTGLQEVKDWCMLQDADLTQQLWDEWIPKWQTALRNAKASKPNTVIPILYELYVNIVSPRLTFAGPAPPTRALIRNGFFWMDERTQSLMEQAMAKLGDATSKFLDSTKRASGEGPLGLIQQAVVELSQARLPIIWRLILNTLQLSPNNKVIAMFNFKNSIHVIADAARQNGISYVEYSGDVEQIQRNRNLDAFQEANNNVRLFLATTAAGDMGIDLDDTQGNYPRTMIIEPTYNFISLYQTMGRPARADTKSIPRIFIVYGQSGGTAVEKQLLDNIARKSGVARSYTQQAEGIPFPSEYKDFIEPTNQGNSSWMDISTENIDQELKEIFNK